MFFTPRPLEWKAFINALFGDDHYFDRLGIRALAGARRPFAVDWEYEAERWEAAWLTADPNP